MSDDYPGRTFVLGAGFSAGAGVPLTSPLLTDATATFSRECPGIYERVCNYASDIDWKHGDQPDFGRISFSELCTHLDFVELRELAGLERWSNDGCREKLALRFYLAKAIAAKTPIAGKVPDLYCRFADALTEKDIVLTFNWDCLLENALTQVGKPYTYAFEEKKIRIAKLHGSINWIIGPPNDLSRPRNTLAWAQIDPKQTVIPDDIWVSEKLLDPTIWDLYQPLREVRPFLILPGYGKAHETPQIASYWYKPEFSFVLARSVYFIGLSLSTDDHFVRSFFLNNLPLKGKKHVIINPAATKQGEYEFIFRGDADLVAEPFSLAHIDRIRADV